MAMILRPIIVLFQPVISATKPDERKKEENKITVTKVYDFAGESIK